MKKISKDEISKELIALTAQLLVESGVTHKREIKLDLSLQRHLGIDSLARAELFQRIEKKFEVTVPDQLLASAETLEDIVNFLTTASPSIKESHHPKTISTPITNDVVVDASKARSLTEVIQLFGELAPAKPHIYFQ